MKALEKEMQQQNNFHKAPFQTCCAVAVMTLFAALAPALVRGQQPMPGGENPPWQFAVSGDSRNCGDVVMPAIAASVLSHKPAFYWHLGDFRKISDFDEDMQHQPSYRATPLTAKGYDDGAWGDFVKSQIDPFGDLRVYLGIGNHELAKSGLTGRRRTRADYLAEFDKWMTWQNLVAQRLKDSDGDKTPHTYYHWVERGVDFINLDNASPDQFDEDQMKWLGKLLDRARTDPNIKTLVVGMHAALPGSLSADHSMEQSSAGRESGRLVYSDLLALHYETHKNIYLLASHSHFYMAGIFRTPYWREHGGVLPGWIIGTAGAQRYPLPANSNDALASQTKVYGYLLATVSPAGEIGFKFQQLAETDLLKASSGTYDPAFISSACFNANTKPME